jgi:hypothetical protein
MSSAKELKDIPFFYILSMGRSGSTLLEFLLDAHPNVNIPLESRFIIHLYYKYSSRTNWTIDDKKNFIADLYKDKKLISFWKIDKRQLENDILNTASTVTFFELCRIITANYISFYPKEKIKIQGSKNPIYGLWSEVLYQLNEQSKFIHLVRNPMGVIASHKKLGKTNLSYYAFRWQFMNGKIERLKTKTPQSFITITYEELTNNPNESIISICQFLGINFLNEQLNFYEIIRQQKVFLDTNNEKEKLEKFDTHLKNLVNPIDTKIGESWKTTLNSKEINMVNYITEKTAMKYGYEFSGNGSFKFSFILAYLKMNYRYLRQRFFYRFSFSIK